MSNKSLFTMIRELQARVAALEAAESKFGLPPDLMVAVEQMLDSRILASKPLDMAKVEENVQRIQANRKMCPKCGVKPNYFFHVKTCSGSQKEQKNAETTVQRRDSSTA